MAPDDALLLTVSLPAIALSATLAQRLTNYQSRPIGWLLLLGIVLLLGNLFRTFAASFFWPYCFIAVAVVSGVATFLWVRRSGTEAQVSVQPQSTSGKKKVSYKSKAADLQKSVDSLKATNKSLHEAVAVLERELREKTAAADVRDAKLRQPLPMSRPPREISGHGYGLNPEASAILNALLNGYGQLANRLRAMNPHVAQPLMPSGSSVDGGHFDPQLLSDFEKTFEKTHDMLQRFLPAPYKAQLLNFEQLRRMNPQQLTEVIGHYGRITREALGEHAAYRVG